MAHTRCHRLVARSLVVGIALLTLAGCSSVRDSLGTVDGGCFLALPTASAAVHNRGHLLGAELVAVDSLRFRPLVYRAATHVAGPAPRRVCLVAFGGTFSDSVVERPAGHESGALAVVVIEYPHSRLLGTVVLSHAPVHFGHFHAGPG